MRYKCNVVTSWNYQAVFLETIATTRCFRQFSRPFHPGKWMKQQCLHTQKITHQTFKMNIIRFAKRVHSRNLTIHHLKIFEDVFPIQDGDVPLLCLFTGGYVGYVWC